MSTVAAINLWDSPIGAVVLEEGASVAVFQYEPEFVRSGIGVSPLVMPLRDEPYSFPGLSRRSFHGLPGLLADSLPDLYGNALIDAWLARQGRRPESFNVVERLCYTGRRGMGALEFAPAKGPQERVGKDLNIDALVELASEVLSNREDFGASLASRHREDALQNILSVGTSAGGARAKAVIAWNPETNAVRSGQVEAGPGFEYWLLKFDGVRSNGDKELEDPEGYGLIEFAYYCMATAAGIVMSECRLLREGGRQHFMTKRFDRDDDGGKRHMQSLAGLAHYDFNQAGAHSYEQAFRVMRDLGLPTGSVEEGFRRMAFNVVARNQDDHVKNMAFLMARDGVWSLAPAFDVAYAYQPSGEWTSKHQMSLNGKRDDFTIQDFRQCGEAVSLKRGRAETILSEVVEAVTAWPTFASDAGVADETIEKIQGTHRLDLLERSNAKIGHAA